MREANIILLFLSASFLASSENLWRFALELRHQKKIHVIPVFTRDVLFPKEFKGLHMLPDNGKSISQWGNEDAAYVNIATGIQKIVQEILSSPTTPPLSFRSSYQPAHNALSRRKLLLYTGLGETIGIALGAAGFKEVTTLTSAQSLTDVRMIMTPSSFPGGLPNAGLPFLNDALMNALGLPVSTTVGQTYLDSINRFDSGEFNVFWASDFAFVISRANYGSSAILRRKNPTSDDPYYYSYILTKAASNISRLADLKGKRLSYVDPYSTSGYLFPRYAMYQAGISSSDVHTKYAGSHEKSLESIFNGQADACAVASDFYKSIDGDSMSATYTDLLQKYRLKDANIRSISRSEPLFTPPIAVHPTISKDDAWRLQKGFLLLQDSTLLQELGIAGFGSIADPPDYNSIRNAAQTLDIDLRDLASP